MTSRGIYIVANAASESDCANLIYSIRKSGCRLPIRLIPFGGKAISAHAVLSEVEEVDVAAFPEAAHAFVADLGGVLTQCPKGFLRRFLAFFGDWDEFLYTDNDVVALMNWERLFDYLPGYDLVHADEEYTTKGRFNYRQPEALEAEFGEGSLLSAFTAGHFIARRSGKLIDDLQKAMAWFRQHPHIPIEHDQALLHVASLLGDWRMLNLCRPPFGWLSSWAGDYANTLAVVQALQAQPARQISHLHYSGWYPSDVEPIHDFSIAHLTARERKGRLLAGTLRSLSGWTLMYGGYKRLRSGVSRRWKRWKASPFT